MIDAAKLRTRDNEGLRLDLYQCTGGAWSIGFGRNLSSAGIRKSEALFLFNNDWTEAENDLPKVLVNWPHVTLARKSALLDMRFQLGHGGFRSFKRMIDALNAGEYIRAAAEVRDSVYWRDKHTHGRAERNARTLESNSLV